ncbi:30S ribosomal protein S20 [soil metagenome]
MANIKSQIKRNRQNEASRQRNKAGRSFLKTRVKRFEEALGSGDEQAAQEAYRSAARELDKAAGKGIIHRNKAATKKSRLARRLNSST